MRECDTVVDQTVDRWRRNMRVAKCANGVEALLIGTVPQNVRALCIHSDIVTMPGDLSRVQRCETKGVISDTRRVVYSVEVVTGVESCGGC